MTAYILQVHGPEDIDILNGDSDAIEIGRTSDEVNDFIMATTGDVEFYVEGTVVNPNIPMGVDEALDLVAGL
jgi:hypothetical protein